MIEVDKELYNTIEAIGNFSFAVSDMVDNRITDKFNEEATIHFTESIEFENKSRKLNKAKEFAEKRISILQKLFEEMYEKGVNKFLDIEASNNSTNQLNAYSENVVSIKKFLESSLGSQLLQKFERMIVLEGIKEYSEKLELIYNLLYYYNTNPKDRPEDQKVSLPRKIK